MRANVFAFTFGIFALVVGIAVDIWGFVNQFESLQSAQVVLIGSIILAIGLAFLSIPNRIERYALQAIIAIGLLYYFYIQTNNFWIGLVVTAILVALIEYGLRHR